MGFDYIVCDSPAGIETGALMAMHFADEALIVTNPEVSSVRDSDRILGMLAPRPSAPSKASEPIKEHLLITRYNPNRVQPAARCSRSTTSRRSCASPLIGVIPESESVLDASNQGVPAMHLKDTRRLRGLQGRGRALPRRGQADALRRRREAGLLQARLRREVAHVPAFLPARREEEDRQRRQGTAADHPRARAQRARAARPTTCRRCSAS